MSWTPPQLDFSQLISSHQFSNLCLVSITVLVTFEFFKSTSFFKNRINRYWPSPPRVPLLGSIPFIHHSHFPHQCLTWRQKYGPIISVKLGTSNDVLIVSAHALAKELFIHHNSTFSGRATPFFYTPQLRLLEYFPPAMATSPHVLAQRTLIQAVIKSSIAVGRGSCLDRSTRALLSKLVSGAPFDIKPLLLQSAAVCAVTLAFGFRWSIDDMDRIPEARAVLHATEEIFEMMQFFDEPTIAFPFLVKLLWWRSRQLRLKATKASTKLLESHKQLYEMAKAQYEAKGEESLESSVAKNLLSSDGEQMSAHQQYCLAGTTMAASMTTTATTIHSALGCLAVRRDTQAQLRAEISKTVEQGCLPSCEAAALRDLPLLQAFIEEVMRLFPTFPILSRVAEKDLVLADGRHILKGQILYINFYGINRDSEVYESPETFDPTRFVNREPTSYWPKYGHASFGAGRRSCPGSEFAMNSISVTLCRLIYCYDIKFPEDVNPSMDLLKPVLVGVEQHTHFPNLIFSLLRDPSELLI